MKWCSMDWVHGIPKIYTRHHHDMLITLRYGINKICQHSAPF